VVVNDFDLLWPGFRPDKAEPELVVDADAVLAMAVSPKGLQAIARWDLQIVETACGIGFPSNRALVSRQRNDLITPAVYPRWA
jgi:hypothetical protein